MVSLSAPQREPACLPKNQKIPWKHQIGEWEITESNIERQRKEILQLISHSPKIFLSLLFHIHSCMCSFTKILDIYDTSDPVFGTREIEIKCYSCGFCQQA